MRIVQILDAESTNILQPFNVYKYKYLLYVDDFFGDSKNDEEKMHSGRKDDPPLKFSGKGHCKFVPHKIL